MAENKKRILRIAILVCEVETGYPELVWKSLKHYAEKHHINLSFFVGSAIESPQSNEWQQNVIYDQINPRLFDGLILLSGVIAKWIDLEKYQKFLTRFGRIPKVSLSLKLKNIPSILIDNKRGIKDCVSHLVIEHGYKRIAFLKGPNGQREAEERYEAYAEVLKENNLHIDPELILQGDFTKDSSVREVSRLLDNNVKIEAIVCANDEMALGVYDCLQTRGIRIPDQIALTGFDNIAISSDLYPPLTTVKQPYELQAQRLFETLISQIEGESTAEETILSTELVIRKSCGCFNQPIQDIDSVIIEKKLTPLYSNRTITDIFSSVRSDILQSRNISSEISINFNSIGMELIKHFLENLKSPDNHDGFIAYLDSLLSNPLLSDDYLYNWQNLLSIFHRNIIRYYKDLKIIPRSENIFQKAMALTSELINRNNNYKNFQKWEYYFLNKVVSRELVSTFDMDELLPLIQKTVSLAQIKNAYLCFYEKIGSKPMKRAKMMLAINENSQITMDNDVLFNTEDLLPGDLFSGTNHKIFIIQPLFFKNDHFGYIIVEDNASIGSIYETIRSQISSAIAGSWQFQKRKVVEKELKETIENLKKTEEKLVESKKMSALGLLVSGIAHEMNEPLEECTTESSHISKKIESVINLYSNKQLKQKDLLEFIDDYKEFSNMIQENLKKTSSLISRFKEISSEKSSMRKIPVNMTLFLKDLPSGFSYLLENKIRLDIQCDEEIEIYSYPEELQIIFSNLFTNSIIHGFSHKTGNIIKISTEKKNHNVLITYTDNGKGIEKEIIDRIFDPFFTTNRANGRPGLGLFIVYNIVTQILEGTIECRSLPGNGVTFNIKIPVD
ncbi:MAG: substrate-binding domain-containing protein [Spirochaetaceae bacterium]|nr:substrate-binding domain-containing protein [Spirochaetaceae bacterium]